MKDKYIKISKTCIYSLWYVVSSILLVQLSLLIASCSNQLPSPKPSLPYHSPIPQMTQTNNHSPTPSVNLNSYGDFRVLDQDQFSISFQWGILDGVYLDEVLILLPYGKYLVEDQKITLDYVSWEGIRGNLLTIEYSGDEEINDFGFFVSALPDSSNRLMVSPLDFVYISEIYVLGLEEDKVFGINPGCASQLSYTRDIAFGTHFLAYRCDESRHLLNILSLNAPFSIHTVNLVGVIEDFLHYEPKWIDDTTLVLEDLFNRGFCLYRAPLWDVICWESPFWAGNVSPDGDYFEVRKGRFDTHPEEVGIQSLDCLTMTADCEKNLRTGWLPSGGDYFLEEAAWLENNQGLLYTVHIQSDGTTMDPNETEFWLLNTVTMEVEKIGHYDGMLSFSPISPSPFPKLWSPDGEWIVVSEANVHYLLSIKTGELKPFAEGGYLLGPLNLSDEITQ